MRQIAATSAFLWRCTVLVAVLAVPIYVQEFSGIQVHLVGDANLTGSVMRLAPLQTDRRGAVWAGGASGGFAWRGVPSSRQQGIPRSLAVFFDTHRSLYQW
ncbi:hypothetical protein [Bryobacter aggregatus]|uniref:hypothetical protein n=1 Tax=Bryobacter aggregatus TaxID=360054 RepID=UPI0004E24183|nr:hypothetical protein [Bryobacter aggregatus]